MFYNLIQLMFRILLDFTCHNLVNISCHRITCGASCKNAPRHAKEGLTDGTPPILGIIPTIYRIIQCINERPPILLFGMTTRWPTVADCVFVCMVAVPLTRDLTHQGPCRKQESSTKIIVMTHSVIFFIICV